MADLCFVGTSRLSVPLDGPTRKKFDRLSVLGRHTVVAFSSGLRPRCFADGARFVLLPLLPGAPLRYVEFVMVAPWLVAWSILRRRSRVVVAQSPFEGFAALVAVRICRALGRRAALVVESHGDFEKSLFLQRRVMLPGIHRFLMARVAAFVLSRADALRAVSRSTAAQLRRYAATAPIVEFPAWTDIDLFVAAGRRRPGPTRTVLFAGTLSPLKRVDLLVEVFATAACDHPDARLRLAGAPSSPEFLAALRARVEAAGLADRVVFLGQLSQERLADEMASALVLVLPSRSEGLGRVLIEAMAAGTPVIGSRVGGIPELVRDGVDGFTFPVDDPAVLEERLRWLLEDPGRAAPLAAGGALRAREAFSSEAYVEGYRRLAAAAAERLEGAA